LRPARSAPRVEGVSVHDVTELRELVGEPEQIVLDKVLTHLEEHSKRFISLSPFIVVGTMSADGRADVSPKGDPPGFVKVVDDSTLVIPDRKGNRRVDSMQNVLENPAIGLIFFVPGIEETLRVNGRASVVDDPALLAGTEVKGHVPTLGVKVEIDEVFFHCAKALKRSKLWDPESRIDRREFPSLGRVVTEQVDLKLSAPELEELDREIEQDYRTSLY
jgi:PPOX class probable FMN-dependent enzyme